MDLKTITSLTNPRVLQGRKLARSSTLRRESGETVLEGRKLVAEALSLGLPLTSVFVSQRFAQENQGWLEAVLPKRLPVFLVPDLVLKKMSSLDHPEGILAIVRIKGWELDQTPLQKWGLVLDGIQEPGNAGAVARVALAFGADCVIFVRGTVDPSHPRAIRGSMGALLAIPFATTEARELVYWARQRRITLIGTHPRAGLSPQELTASPPLLLVFGSEGHGISPELEAVVDARIRIPTQSVESLPVVVAAGIVSYEMSRRFSG